MSHLPLCSLEGEGRGGGRTAPGDGQDWGMPSTGILCMAYGSPRTEADVEAYFTDIRGGRPPSAHALEELRGRYRASGGSPLEEITRRQAAALGRRLGIPAFVGMKHSPPFIAEGAADAGAA